MEQKTIKIADLEINRGQIDGLPKNPRTIKDARFEALKKSIEDAPEMLALRELLVFPHNGKFVVIGGNMRLKACKELGYKELPCKVIDENTPVEKLREYTIKDNIGFGDDDWNLLTEDWDRIELEDWGFEFPETENLSEDIPDDVVEDEVPDECESIVKLGDVWQLGENLLMCGDSTNADDVAKLMNGEKSELLFTSPPYSDMRDYRGGKDLEVANISRFISTYSPFCRYQAVNLGLQMKNYEIYPYWNEYISEAKSVNLKLLAWNVWDKINVGSIGAQKQFFPLRHEWIFVFGNEPKALNRFLPKKEENVKRNVRKTGRRQSDGSLKLSSQGDMSSDYKTMSSVINCHFELSPARHLHPATYPVELPFQYIVSLTDKNDIVVEPFGGSGTTLIACEQLERRCRCMELDPHYCDVIIARWENFTGKTAVKINE